MSERQTSGNATYKPARPGNGILANHPQRQLIVDAILKGDSSVAIHKWVSPRVSRVTISELARQVRHEAQQALILEQAKQLQSVAAGVISESNSVAKFTRDAVMGQQHLSRIQQHQDRTSRLLDQAEANGDIGSVATLIKTDYQGIRLAAELDGSLAQSIGPQVTVNSQVIVLPQFASEELEPAIEVPVEPV